MYASDTRGTISLSPGYCRHGLDVDEEVSDQIRALTESWHLVIRLIKDWLGMPAGIVRGRRDGPASY